MAGYYVVAGTDVNGCINSDSILIDVLALPLVDATISGSSSIFCLSSIISLTAIGASVYSWNGPNNFNSNVASPSITDITNSNQGWYSVTGTDSENCISTDSVYVVVIPNVPAQSAANDTVVCPGESVILIGNGGATYDWSGPQGSISSGQSLTLTSMTINQSGWYQVMVTDSNGCLGYDSTYISVEP